MVSHNRTNKSTIHFALDQVHTTDTICGSDECVLARKWEKSVFKLSTKLTRCCDQQGQWTQQFEHKENGSKIKSFPRPPHPLSLSLFLFGILSVIRFIPESSVGQIECFVTTKSGRSTSKLKMPFLREALWLISHNETIWKALKASGTFAMATTLVAPHKHKTLFRVSNVHHSILVRILRAKQYHHRHTSTSPHRIWILKILAQLTTKNWSRRCGGKRKRV